MNPAQPAAATRTPARAPQAPADESVAAERESLHAHAMRLLRARLSVMACGVLDPGIGLLQRLRQHAGGAQDADADAEDRRIRPRSIESGSRRDANAPAEGSEAEAPKPKRRVRAFLIYACILLAGGMGGGALAYELLAKLLFRQAAESRRVEAAMAKQSKSSASNQKKLDEALAERVQAEKKLEEAQAKRTEAEKDLEAALNDSKAAAEKQKKLDEAVKLLESIRGAERSSAAQRPAPVSSSGTARAARPPKSANCTLGTGDANAVKDCLEEFNR